MVRHWARLSGQRERTSAGAAPQAAGQRRRRGRHRRRVRDRPRDQVRPGRMDRRPRRADPLRGHEGDLPPLRERREPARAAAVRRGAAGPRARRRPGLEPARADAAGARLRAGDPPGDPARAHGGRERPTTCCRASGRSAGSRSPSSSSTPPTARRCGRCCTTSSASPREARRRNLGRDPRIRGRALVAEPAAQPDGAAAQGPTAVRARGHRDERAVGPGGAG